MASKTFASLFGLGNDAFSNHDRPYVDTLAEFAAATAAPGHKSEVLGYPDAFPTLCPLISDADPTSILLGSSPTLYRGILYLYLTSPSVLANGTCSQHACFTDSPSIEKIQHPKG